MLLFNRLCYGCICGFLVSHLWYRRLLLLTFVHGNKLAAADHTLIVLEGGIGLLSESGLVLHVERDVARQEVLAHTKALVNDTLSRLEVRKLHLGSDNMFLDDLTKPLIVDILEQRVPCLVFSFE